MVWGPAPRSSGKDMTMDMMESIIWLTDRKNSTSVRDWMSSWR